MLCSSLQDFDRLIEDWVLKRGKGEKEETHPWKISEQELQAQREKVSEQQKQLSPYISIYSRGTFLQYHKLALRQPWA